MRLKNKKTGEMGIVSHFDNQSIVIYPIDENWNAKGDKKYVYASLAELNEEWCDYEEPKKFWYMTAWGDVYEYSQSQFAIKQKQAIGNYFETREEAEKVVERLRAWKRLKDKGFRFEGHSMLNYAPNDTYDYSPSIGFSIPELDKDEPYEYPEEIEKDLDICFGGEE